MLASSVPCPSSSPAASSASPLLDPELLVEPDPEPLEPPEPPPPEEVPGPLSAFDCALEEPHAQSARHTATQGANAADAKSGVSPEAGAR